VQPAPFRDSEIYEPPVELPRCECGGRIRPHICWFGEVPFELDRIFRALDECTIFMAVGTSGLVEPAASFVANVSGRARTIYVGASLRTHPGSRNVSSSGKLERFCPLYSPKNDLDSGTDSGVYAQLES
jgi:NAD-dependent SIR2 family protein deacetylase